MLVFPPIFCEFGSILALITFRESVNLYDYKIQDCNSSHLTYD